MNGQMPEVALIKERALKMRKQIIDLALNTGPGTGIHFGPSFSIIEIMATLYTSVLKYDPQNPRWPDRDRFILSKGHASLSLYTALVFAGFIPEDLLGQYAMDQSPLAGHPCMNIDLGIEASTGSLGHGLSIAVGMALAGKMNKKNYNVYTLIGDGESNEGTIWEAIMSASNYKLDNLVVILDRNECQADGFARDIMDMGDMAAKFSSFGWAVHETDGHDIEKLLMAFHPNNRTKDKPYAVVAHTVKGKGISFFENNKTWHHYRNFTQDLADKCLAELMPSEQIER
jgi:transketolase